MSYNQVALIDKTPVELNLKDCIKVYIEHNTDCIIREATFDKNKAESRIHIIDGLLLALANIDNIINLIKKSSSSTIAKEQLIKIYNFSEEQAKAILEMKLAKLSKLGKEELENEKEELLREIELLIEIINHPIDELVKRLKALVSVYGDARRTELIQLNDTSKEEEEIENIEPEKCVVIMTESGNIKRIPTTSFKTQRKGGKGVKSQDEIVSAVIRTNTIDSLMIFSDKGKMYRLLVNDIPIGTNASKGSSVKALVSMETDENPQIIYSIYRDTDAKYVIFVTKNGLVKKTSLEEYIKTKKKTGISAITIKEGDSLAAVSLIKEEPLVLITEKGMVIKFNSTEIGTTSRTTSGIKGITLNENDIVIGGLPIRHETDSLAIFSSNGLGKRISLSELPIQKRAGKGLTCYKPTNSTGNVVTAVLVEDNDNILILGEHNNICISAKEVPILNRASIGNQIIKSSKINSVSKV